MLSVERKFFKPSKETRVLAILDSLSQDSELSQSELGRRLHLSGAMVNQYLKELQDDEMIQYEALNGKSYRYVLTASGEKARQKMFSDFSSETIQIYTSLKQVIFSKVDGAMDRGLTKFALFGASETCEVVLSTLKDTGLDIVVVVDSDPEKQGKIFHGHVISPPEILDVVECQAVLITSFGRQDEIYEQLRPLKEKKGLEIVRL